MITQVDRTLTSHPEDSGLALRRSAAVIGGVVLGLGLGVTIRGVMLNYPNVAVFGGVLLGLGVGVLAGASLRK